VGGPSGVMKHEPRRLSWFVFAIHDTTISGENNENDEKVEVGKTTRRIKTTGSRKGKQGGRGRGNDEKQEK